MLSDIGSVKDFLVGEIKELQYEGFLYCRQNIEVPPFDKGILIGKELAYGSHSQFYFIVKILN